MRINRLGDGKAEYTVVGSLHGDEPCGKKAIERFLSEDWEVKKPVKFIVANEEALERGVRYIDNDINRVFPGDPESDRHEEQLASEVMREVVGTRVLDIRHCLGHR
ncbi:MAG: succinylglutamate desuccinylase/aspartoacylase family protein [Candidatus Nanohaloarchaea archaeon]